MGKKTVILYECDYCYRTAINVCDIWLKWGSVTNTTRKEFYFCCSDCLNKYKSLFKEVVNGQT